jgi:YD repeat-containing protein
MLLVASISPARSTPSTSEATVSKGPRNDTRASVPPAHSIRRHDNHLLLSFALPLLVLNAPTSLSVTTAATTQISLSWTAPSGSVNHYQIERSTSLSGPFTTIGTSTTTSFNNTGLSGVHSYLYRVRAVDSFGAPSAPSNMALGTSIAFADPTLYANVTEIKAQHIYDLRQAIDAVRAVVPSLSTVSWTPSSLEQVIVHATDVQDLRDKLGDALSALNISPGAYEDSTLATGASGTLIKKIHIEQLRERSTKGSSTSSGPADYSYADSSTARLDPLNRTGGGGEDPLSRNFNWSVPLVGLPGRGGLDLGLSLAYNSLATWTRTGSTISFDDDYGFPAPGFQLGFPVIQAAYYNSQASKYSFLMITPSGGRVELRQVGTSDLYQAVDSSYLLLDSSTMTLRTTDGTQLTYMWMGSNYECTQIKDRNGNYLSVDYDDYGRIETVKDTLSRTITFNYDTNGLSSITQTWAGQTHYWARFTYASKTIQTNFTNLTVNGPQNNSTIRTLTQVKLADDSHYDFDYTSWGQVWKISQYTGETTAHLLNYRSYNLPADYTTAQTDCPRFTVRHDWAENWNRDTNGAAQEVNTSYTEPVDAALPDNSLATVTRTQVTMPDGTSQKIYFAGNIAGGAGSAPAWKRGLPLLTDTFESGNSTPQRSATTAWTQDDTNASYQLNPRVTETNITDPAGNHARTSIEYASTTLSDGTTINLPQNTYEYQADASTQLRRTHVEYNLNSAYVSRRIIGLASEQTLYGGATSSETLMSKVSYQYDESGSIQGTDAPVQHDNSNYGASLVAGRGNVSSVKRYDVNSTSFTTSSMQYNTAGAVVATADPLNHGVTISYADQFSANGTDLDSALGFTTLAYPTTVTDAGGFTATTRYNYAFGGATRKQTPLPNVTNNQAGPVQIVEYDSFGRLQKVKNLVNNAYTRYEYPASQIRVDTYTTILSTTSEAHSFKITDGHGRVIGSAADHPGSTGGYSGQRIFYDTMGRVIKQSNPTETSASGNNPYSWSATGDDATAGWLDTQQTYDWKGRPLVTTNTDSTTKSASYGGCGCAGGQVVTLTDEVGRHQKVYSDVLGRTVKTEILDASNAIYSATATEYNVRDQITAVKTYTGAAESDLSCPSGTCMQSVRTYDGYGRLATQKLPQQTTAGAYTYNAGSLVDTVTDPRGVVATNTYNNRNLLTGVSYSVPSGIDALASVSFSYDSIGNRLSMSDGTGSINYSYDQLSQLTSETRSITGLSNSYTTSYTYGLSGALASITDPSGAQVSYNYDNTGRLTSMPASGYSGITNFLSNAQYRASGAMKHATYGNSVSIDLSYNSRMQISQYQVGGFQNNGTAYNMGATMTYYDDGRTNTAFDLQNSSFDRKYEFDFSARLKEAYTGPEAHGESAPPLSQATSPYRQTYTYDVWNNVTVRDGRIWAERQDLDTATYGSDNKRQGWGYDAAGNATWTGYSDGARTYDAAGRPATFTSGQTWQAYPDWPSGHPDAPALETQDTFDGTGQAVKHIHHTRHDDSYDAPSGFVYDMSDTTTTTYYLHSTVLGGKTIAELDQSGVKMKGFVYAGGSRLATQTVYGSSDSVQIESTNPVTGATIVTDANASSANRQEPDPLGRDLAEAAAPEVIGDPLSNPKSNEPMPIEASWGPSAEYEQANAGRAAQMDAYEAEKALFYGRRATWEWILHKNPNVGVRTSSGGRTSYGDEAISDLLRARNDRPNNPFVISDDPTTPQNPVGIPSEANKMKMNHAFADAASAIAPNRRKNNPCFVFFTKGRSLEEVSRIFKNFWETAQINANAAFSIAGTRNSGQGMGARVTFYAPFFADTGETESGMLAGYNWSPERGRYEELFTGLTPRQYRALGVLHEFAHALGLILSDKDDKRTMNAQSQKNDQIIYEKCGAFLERLAAQ